MSVGLVQNHFHQELRKFVGISSPLWALQSEAIYAFGIVPVDLKRSDFNATCSVERALRISANALFRRCAALQKVHLINAFLTRSSDQPDYALFQKNRPQKKSHQMREYMYWRQNPHIAAIDALCEVLVGIVTIYADKSATSISKRFELPLLVAHLQMGRQLAI